MARRIIHVKFCNVLRSRFRLRQGCGGRAGQAMAEFLVGLVAVMLLLVGLQQVAFLSNRGYAAMNNARREMARDLMDPGNADRYNFGFGAPTRPGNDRKMYTADDRRQYENDSFYQDNGYLEKVYDADLGDYFVTYDREVPHYDLEVSSTYDTSEQFKMMHASDQQEVDVVPFLDRVLGRKTIYIGRDVVMPRLDRVKR